MTDRIDPLPERGRSVEPVVRPRLLTPVEREEERRQRERRRRERRRREPDTPPEDGHLDVRG